MNFTEILKAQNLTDEQIVKISAEMKSNKIYLASEENLDVRYNSKYYVIKQNGTQLEGSADYPYLVYEMSTSTPLGTWTYSGSGYASTQAYLYWAEASNTDIYNWTNLSTKGSTIHFAKNTD